MDSLRDHVTPERWARKVAERVDAGDPRMLEYVGNRFLGLPRHATEDTEAIRAAVQAQAQASALVVVVDGQAVQGIEAERAAARMMLERFTQTRQPETNGPDDPSNVHPSTQEAPEVIDPAP